MAALALALVLAAGGAEGPPRRSQPITIRSGDKAAEIVRDVGQGRPVLLHFWATWCDACRDEFPKLRPLLLGLEARGVGVALVSIDAPALAITAQDQLERWGLGGLPSFLLDAPSPDPVAAAIGSRKWTGTLPATFLFDARGRLAKSFIGAADPARVEKSLRRLRAKRR